MRRGSSGGDGRGGAKVTQYEGRKKFDVEWRLGERGDTANPVIWIGISIVLRDRRRKKISD